MAAALAFARQSLAAYAIGAYPSYEVAPHHRLIAHALERVTRGELKRLMIWAPPRHGKSLLTSTHFPAWYLGHHPDRYIIATSYQQDLAEDFGRSVRNQMRDPFHGAAFPGSELRDDSKAAARFHTSAGGVYFGVGMGGPLTGRGAHVLLIDDPVKNDEQARSEAVRERHKTWYARDAKTRLMPDGAVVIIQTRWNEDDLSGWLLREGDEEWTVLCLRAIAEGDDPLGRPAGAPLWPSRYSLQTLEGIRDAPGMGAAWWALYQQRPQPEGGGILKTTWWRRWRHEAPPPEAPSAWARLPTRFDEIVQSWDLAFKGTSTSDFVVGQVWGRVGAQYFLLDQVRGRWDFPTTILHVRKLAAKWPGARMILVEDKANGPAVIAQLSREIGRIIAVNPEGGKQARVHAIAPLIEAGNAFIPGDDVAPWVRGYVQEATDFPRGVNDDQVDATSQALVRMSRPMQVRSLQNLPPG